MGKKTDLESVHLVNHSKCMLAAFQNFRQDETMLDATLVCDGMSIKAHKLVLSACSPLLKEIFSENPCQHPVIILRNFEFSDLKAVIDFIYKGELSVPRERLMSALKVAEDLNIRGLRRSEPNREKYEKLYNQVCGKLSGRKKRKRHRTDSSDSEEKAVQISASESDQNIIESEISLSADDEVPLESNQVSMDVESVSNEGNSENSKDVRPVVLRVGDSPASNVEPIQKNEYEDEASNVIHPVEESSLNDNSQDGNVTSQQEEIENQEYALESATGSSQLEVACSENSNVSLECVTIDEANNFKEQNAGILSVGDCSETVGLVSSCLSPKSEEEQQNDEAKPQDEGKRFICSKCGSVFTSRINFMRHKTLGHNNMEKKSPYDCKHCNFTTEELDNLKSHLLMHSDYVPFKCYTCPEEFTSEELYKKHLSVHEVEKSLLHLSSSSPPGQDFFSTQNRNPEKIMEFRCSICFIKFTSKLRCQIHEKTCQGGS